MHEGRERAYERAVAAAETPNGVSDDSPEAQRGDAWEPPHEEYAGDHTLYQPGFSAPLAWKPFPCDALPKPAEEYVNAASSATGCDPSYVAVPLLTGLGAGIGNSRRLVLKKGWSEPAVIWGVTIGESGTLKSPGCELALRPILARQAEALRRHHDALDGYDIAEIKYQAQLADWKSQGRKGESRSSEPPQKPARPVCPRYLASDVTIEALAVRLQQAPRGLLVYRDELSGWLRSFDAYRGGRGGDVAHWLTVHGARDLLMDRKTGTQETIYAPRAFACITGTVPPEVLRQCLAREHFEDGLAARLLMAWPPRQKKQWTEYDIEPNQVSALAELYGGLYELEMSRDDQTGQDCPALVVLTKEAKTVWVDFHNAHANEMMELVGDVASAWAKLEGYAARLALVHHCCVMVSAGERSAPLGAASMIAGIRLARWFGHETRRIYAVLQESQEQRERRELIELIRSKGGSITVRELMRSAKLYSEVGLAEAALNALVGSGLATRKEVERTRNGGRPSFVYRFIRHSDK